MGRSGKARRVPAARMRPRRPPQLSAGLLLLALAAPAAAQDKPPVLPADATLSELIRESLAVRPEIQQAKSTAQAREERVRQAGALPDPMLQVGIQNDGFTSIEIGRMGTSFVSLMASQTFPWPGKRGLSQSIAQLGANQALRGIDRTRLST